MTAMDTRRSLWRGVAALLALATVVACRRTAAG